jgi:hypothetical protein
MLALNRQIIPVYLNDTFSTQQIIQLKQHANSSTYVSGNSRTLHAHCWYKSKTKNEDRVENNIQDVRYQ